MPQKNISRKTDWEDVLSDYPMEMFLGRYRLYNKQLTPPWSWRKHKRYLQIEFTLLQTLSR